MTTTPTPTGIPFENASSSIQTGFADGTGLGGIIIILLYIIGALLAARHVAPWLAQSRFITRTGTQIATSFVYAIKGVAATAVLAAAAAPVYLLTQVDGSTRGIALRYIAYAAVAYISLVVIGWLADRAVTAFVNAHPDIDTIDDLIPEPRDDEPPDSDKEAT